MDSGAAAVVTVNHEVSMFGMFFQASFVVQMVMLLLVVASFWSWTIIFSKMMMLRKLKQSADKFEESFWSGGSLDVLMEKVGQSPKDPFATVFVAAMKEWKRSVSKGISNFDHRISLRDRIGRIMNVVVSREIEQLEKSIGFLATVGSTAPFIGLFGMVWGVMNSFQSIGIEKNASIASVAPGIAEALFVTAIGLVVTIPSVVGYNKISSEINSYANRLDAFVEEFLTIISRQLEEHTEN